MKTLVILIIISVGIIGVMSGIVICTNSDFSKIFEEDKTDLTTQLDGNQIIIYDIDTECKALLSLYDLSLQEKTINQLVDLEILLEKYPMDGEIIREYTFNSIQSNNSKNMPRFQDLPPTVLNSIINVMMDIGSVDPILKPFLTKVLSGEITRDEIIQIFINDNTECEKELVPFMTIMPPSI